MNLQLLNKSYENFLNIDFKSIHHELNTFSEYHTKGGLKLEINDLNLTNFPIKFTTCDQEQFELINYENKNFLVSKNSYYPCSRVYENTLGDRWVEVLIIPNEKKLFIDNNDSSVKYSFYTLQLFKYLKTSQDILNFDKANCNTFSCNNWFNESQRVQFFIRAQANPNEIIKAIHHSKLFNPFQLGIISITENIKISKNDIKNYVLYNSSISLNIPYIFSPSSKFKISGSTNDLIKTNDFSNFIDSMTDEEVYQFFELEFLEESLDLDNIYPELKLDILGIKILERWKNEGYPGNVAKHIQNRLASVNISEKLINLYYKKLKQNLRSIENKIRIQKGFNIVGSLYNESLLFQLIQEAFPKYNIISQYSPEWLGRQRIDIFIEELKIAIEYNGRQHYEPIAYFGGKEGFLKTVERDKIKRRKCTKNGCQLIEIKYNEDLKTKVKKIKIEHDRINDSTPSSTGTKYTSQIPANELQTTLEKFLKLIKTAFLS